MWQIWTIWGKNGKITAAEGVRDRFFGKEKGHASPTEDTKKMATKANDREQDLWSEMTTSHFNKLKFTPFFTISPTIPIFESQTEQ